MAFKACALFLLLVSFTTAKLLAPAPIDAKLLRRDVDPAILYPAYNISVPIDHFFNDSQYAPHSNGTFELRYWFDASHYVEGGPVIVLNGGEVDASTRLPYLQKGILADLVNATNGLGVVIEHRYYGTSFPTSDLSTENLRFLTTDQAMADMVYFAQTVVFEGLEDLNLTAPNVPYLAYGGSYAGALVAFLRVLYPDVYWGTISSSGVTKAIYDYWEYYEPIREYGPPDCISTQQKIINVVDEILVYNATFAGRNNSEMIRELKAAFGMENVTYNDDFASVLSYGIGGWQGRNWDPAVNDPSFSYYCGNITDLDLVDEATDVEAFTVQQFIIAAGWGNETATLIPAMLNWIAYTNTTYLAPCADSGSTQDECFGTHNATFYQQDSLADDWRSWPYQYCTQWGFLQTGSGVPADELPLISRALTLAYEGLICQLAFNITTPPDTDAVNKYGGYDIAYDRLAIIGGEQDPWRPATPLAPEAKNRTSTEDQPVILIQGAVHHWDENGLFPNETTPDLPPKPVADAQAAEVTFVKQWLTEWVQR